MPRINRGVNRGKKGRPASKSRTVVPHTSSRSVSVKGGDAAIATIREIAAVKNVSIGELVLNALLLAEPTFEERYHAHITKLEKNSQ